MEVPVWLLPDRRKSPSLRGGKRKSPERRISPRFAISLPAKVTFQHPEKKVYTSIKGKIVNLNEWGLDLIVESSLTDSNRFLLSIESSFDALRTGIPLQLVWSAPRIKAREFLYGFKFLKLDAEQIFALRKLLYLNENYLAEQVNSIIKLIPEMEIAEKVRGFFTGDVRNYLGELAGLEKEIYLSGPTNSGQVKLNRLNDEILKKAGKLEEILGSPKVLKEIKKIFRLIVGGFAYQSAILRRANDKPLGYPGDYRLLELIYDNHSLSEKIGYYFDKSFLCNNYAVAVRNRKDKMKSILEEFIGRSSSPMLKILNLACGSCREIKELLSSSVVHKRKIVFECVDQDQEALAFAKGSMGKLPENIEIKFLKENILDIINRPFYSYKFLGKQDLVYSIGLADYLPDRILKKLINFSFGSLHSGGKLIITHKDIDKYKPLDPDWFCDWTFIPRNARELSWLIEGSGIDNFSISLDREPSQIIIFLTVEKPQKEVNK